MKLIKTTLLINLLLLLFSGTLISQTVNVYNMYYIDGTSIPLGGPIEIENNENVRIQFSINVNNPPGVEGTLTVYTTRFSEDSPTQHGGSETIFSGTTFFTSSRDITLHGNNFFASGGKLYAEFKSVGNVAYKSGTYNIIVNGGSSGGGGNQQNHPPITYNQIKPGGQFLYPGNDTPDLIYGTQPQGGTGTYIYNWTRKINDGAWHSVVGGSSHKNYQPPTPAQGSVVRYRRLVTSGGMQSQYSNVFTLNYESQSTSNTIVSDKVIIELGESVEFTGNDLIGLTNRGLKWMRSFDNVNYFAAGRPSFCHPNSPVGGCLSYPTQNSFYKRNAEFVDGTFLDSNIIFVKVVLEANDIIYDSTICQITGSVPRGEYGVGSYTYQWFQRSVNGNWNPIPGATNKDYSPPSCSPSSTTQYKRVVHSNISSGSSSSFLDNAGYSSNFIEILGFNDGINIGRSAIIFPNPSKDGNVNVNLDGRVHNGNHANVILYNLSGLQLFQKQLEVEGNSLIRDINLSAFEKGIYLLKIVTDKGIFTEQLIIN